MLSFCACVRACVRACVCVCVSVFVCLSVSVSVYLSLSLCLSVRLSLPLCWKKKKCFRSSVTGLYSCTNTWKKQQLPLPYQHTAVAIRYKTTTPRQTQLSRTHTRDRILNGGQSRSFDGTVAPRVKSSRSMEREREREI